jgi:hypothetical protein
MFSLFTLPPAQHFIDNGHVFCPTRGRDVDFDLCAGCASLEAIDLEAKPPFVRCAPLAPGAWLLRRLV